MLQDLLYTLAGFGIPIPLNLVGGGPVVWEGAPGSEWVYDPFATENGFVLRMYARTPNGDLDIAFTPFGRIARAVLGEQVLSDEAALTWLKEGSYALG